MASAITGWTTDINSASTSSLTQGARYYFNVMARDVASNISIYTSSCGPDIVVKYNGSPIALGGTVDLGNVYGYQTFTFTIQNTGDQRLYLTHAAPNYVYYATSDAYIWGVFSQPASDYIDPGNTRDFIISFASYMNPYAERYATIYVEGNDPTTWNYWFQVQGYAMC
jgi:hypothetical protein